jgi:Holliday junction resolvase
MTANKLTKQIIEYLTLQGHYVFRQNNIPTKRRSNTTHKGVADIMGCTKKGIALAVEVKIDKDKQSSYQIEFEKQYKKRGGIYIIAKTLEDVTKIL